MRKLTYMIFPFIVFLSGCNTANNIANKETVSLEITLDKLKKQKAYIDTLFTNSREDLLIWAKLENSEELIKIENENFPSHIKTVYNVLNDSLGKLVRVSEIPISQTGDWSIVYTHYFDKSGKTFAFERQTNFFNSICADGMAYETQTMFYNANFELLEEMYKLVDKEGNSLQKYSCQFPYDFKFNVLPNTNDFSELN